MTKAFSYVRMSTDKQQHGDSLRRQRQAAESYCKQHGLELDDQFKLTDVGFSAFTGDHIANGSLGHFLTAVREKRIPIGSFLLIESHDRLSRMEPRKAMVIFLELLNSGISIVVLDQEKVFSPDSHDHFDLLQAVLEMVRSHSESKRKSDMGKATWERKRAETDKKIMTALAPLWLRHRDDRTGFELVPERVAIVENIFEMTTTENMGADAIARELNRRGIAPFGAAKRGWQKSSVLKILKNQAVLGQYQPHSKIGQRRVPKGPVIQQYFPAVIDENLFFRAQHKLASRKLAGGGRRGLQLPNLFSKLVRCGYCGGPMHYVDKGKKGGKSLVCDTARRKVRCHAAPWPYADFQRSVLSFVREINAQQLTTEFVHDGELSALSREIESMKGKLAAAKAHRQQVFGLLTGEQATGFVREKFDEADTAVAVLDREIAGLQARAVQIRSENEIFTAGSLSLIELLDQTKERDIAAYTELRNRLRSALVSVIEQIILYPIGSLSTITRDTPGVRVVSDGQHEYLLLGNIQVGMQRGDVRRRHFTITFRDGTRRRVKPSVADPTKFDWIGEGDADPVTHQQIVEMAGLWGIDPVSPADFLAVQTRLAALSSDSAKADDTEVAAYAAKNPSDTPRE